MKILVCLSLVFALVSSLSAQDAKKKKKPRKVNPAMAPVTDVEGLPRVLIIGDSISIGYTVAVREGLKGKVNLHRPLTNCGPTTRGLDQLDKWLATGGADKKWDVIHFNWGLHDLKYMGAEGQNLADPTDPKSKQQVPPDAYKTNLDQLVTRLKKTGATLIWRNTTPVPEGCKGRVPGHSAAYNKIAAEVMKQHGVQTHDLFTYAKANEKDIQLPANVHYSAAGSKALGAEVVKVITAALEK